VKTMGGIFYLKKNGKSTFRKRKGGQLKRNELEWERGKNLEQRGASDPRKWARKKDFYTLNYYRGGMRTGRELLRKKET